MIRDAMKKKMVGVGRDVETRAHDDAGAVGQGHHGNAGERVPGSVIGVVIERQRRKPTNGAFQGRKSKGASWLNWHPHPRTDTLLSRQVQSPRCIDPGGRLALIDLPECRMPLGTLDQIQNSAVAVVRTMSTLPCTSDGSMSEQCCSNNIRSRTISEECVLHALPHGAQYGYVQA